MTLERCRKDAKALLRAVRAGDPAALARVEHVSAYRKRLHLADAQHVIAVERGFRTWPELKRALEERTEEVIDSGLAYAPGDPVLVRVVKRGRRYLVTDDGGAVARAGKPRGWRDAAERALLDDPLNVSRAGVVFVPAVEGGLPVDSLVERVAKLSLALYQEILELD